MRHYIKTLIFLFLVLISPNAYAFSSGLKVLSDIPYGDDTDQVLDVYVPANAKDAPVIFMVHGGAWGGGDKARKAEFENKVTHWVAKGFIFISTNYRTLPKMDPVGQAKDVETALLFSQKRAREWGGSPEKFILMGHSSGAHLISLVSTNNGALTGNRITPWLGTISLDSAPYNFVTRLTSPTPPERYKTVFGNDPNYWKKASPFYSLTGKIPPFLAICSTRSATACIEAEKFLKKAMSLGTHGEILAVDLSHREINSELGKESCYTKNVDDFLKKLSPDIETLLTVQDAPMQKNCAGN